MSSVVKKDIADKKIFKHTPKGFRVETTEVAKDFVALQITEVKSDFQIADVVAQQSGITALRKKNIENQVEETVLERLKEIEEQAYRQAYDLGLIEGQEKAFTEKTQDFIAKMTTLDDLLSELQNMKMRLHKENEIIFIKLIFQIAEKIAMREIAADQTPLVAMLTDLVEEVQSADAINIKLNPSDLSFIEELRSKKVKEVEGLERIRLVAAPDITIGGCIVETNFGSIEATLEQRVAKAWGLIEAKLPKIST